VFRLDLRGCGAGSRLARRSLHAGRVDDLLAAARFIRQLSPRTPLTLVGFSLGASLVLKLLGGCDDPPVGIDSAIAVAPPLDLQACSRNLNSGWNRIYDRSFVRLLRRYVEYRRRCVPDLADSPWQRPPASLYEFDAAFTAPLGGFADVEDYYRSCSSLPDLPNIRVPTRILFAQDDPLVPSDVFGRAEFSSTTRVYATPGGGHLGFLARTGPHSPDADWHWMDWRIVDWVREFGIDGAHQSLKR
jgi:predicted alpha/beta-fold hydrolase